MKPPLRTDTLFSLMVFGCFAALALTALLFGARVYKNIVDITSTHERYDDRLCLSYLWTKIKNSDTADSIHICEFGGVNALCLDESIDGVTYRTLIYTRGGRLYELFSETELAVGPEDGTELLEVSALQFESCGDGLIRITAGRLSLYVALRSR